MVLASFIAPALHPVIRANPTRGFHVAAISCVTVKVQSVKRVLNDSSVFRYIQQTFTRTHMRLDSTTDWTSCPGYPDSGFLRASPYEEVLNTNFSVDTCD
ncbi:hypothetical protein BaRGS_00014950 [Batillaria attramentaria]|uniref:Secreted protein n=1 Tax=Batillaria attramentaria TaxID=370345 RepID=A0ABD0L3U4_9CAEN